MYPPRLRMKVVSGETIEDAVVARFVAMCVLVEEIARMDGKDSLGGVVNDVKYALGGVVNDVKYVLDGVVKDVKYVLGGVVNDVKHVLGGVEKDVKHVLDGVVNDVKYLLGGVVNDVKYLLDGVVKGFCILARMDVNALTHAVGGQSVLADSVVVSAHESLWEEEIARTDANI